MKTTLASMFALLLSAGVFPSSMEAQAQAQAQAKESNFPEDLPVVTLSLGTVEAAAACPVKGGLCVSAAAPSTQLVGALFSFAPVAGKLPLPAPSFARLLPASLAARSAADLVPWSLELGASLRRPAQSGALVFVFTDPEDPEQSPESHVVTAAYSIPITARTRIAARLNLTADEGFRPGHTYLLRLMQVQQGAETELAAGEIRLQ